MNVLVTGCAGFIASRVTELLLDAGHDVVGMDNLNDAYDVRLKRWRLDRVETRSGFSFREADVAKLDSAFEVVGQGSFEAIVNLAARAGVRASVEDPFPFYRTNVEGTLNLLEAARRHGVPRFLLASTSSLYGNHNARPFREDADTDRPLSPYAASKKAAETLVRTYHEIYGIEGAILRYFTVYGPAGRPDMSVFRFIRWVAEGEPVVVLGDGRQERDFTYVDDIARGTIAALGLPGLETINLGSDRPVPLMDLVRIVEAGLGRTARVEHRPGHFADARATWANIEKAERLLGWRPRVKLEEGVANAIRWYQENREWAHRLRL